MSDSLPQHEFQNPRLSDLHTFFVGVQKIDGDTETRHGIVSVCKRVWGGEISPVEMLFRLQDNCAWLTEKIASSRQPERAKRIYQDHLDRAREMLLAVQGSTKWSEFQQRSAHLPDQLVQLDVFLGEDSVNLQRAESLTKTALSDIAVLRNSVTEDPDLPTELRELVLAQLGLLERSVSRFTTMGFSSFQEVIELSYGKLSLVMAHSQQPNTLKRVQQLLDLLLKIHSGAEMAREGVRLLQHVPIKALAPPRDAA